MRIQPQSIDDRPSISERIGRFFSGLADFEVALEAMGFVLSLVIGLGVLGFVGFAWISHFFQAGRFLVSGSVALVFVAICFAATTRPHTVLVIILGAAAICGVAFLSGADNALLP